MKKIKTTCVWFLALFAVCCFVVAPAHAGIIITEGKIAEEGDEPESKTSSERRGSTGNSDASNDGKDNCGELDDDGLCVQVDGTLDGVELSDIDNLDTDEPEGWTCTDVSGGLQYCEPNGATGSSPGAGAGGGLGGDVTMGGGVPMGGCQGGGQGTPWPTLLVLFAVAMVLRRTRGSVTSS